MSSPLEFGNPPRCCPPGYRLHAFNTFMPSCLHAFMPSCLHAFMPSCLHAFMPSTRFYMPCMDFTKSGRRSPLICFAVRLNFIFYYYNFAVRLSQGEEAHRIDGNRYFLIPTLLNNHTKLTNMLFNHRVHTIIRIPLDPGFPPIVSVWKMGVIK